MRVRFMVGTVGMMLTLLTPVSVGGADEMTAILDGQRISVARAAELSCHDLDYPVITCFSSSKEMLEAVSVLTTERSDGGTEALATGYVIVWADATFAGASRTLSINYPYLGDIGWNDRISSFRSYGASGRFREHSPGSGFIYSYSSSAYVTYVGDVYNDKFSAFVID